MSDAVEDYELFHYGVKGMKWGVRRPSLSGVKSSRAYKVGDTIYTKTGLKARDNKIKEAREDFVPSMYRSIDADKALRTAKKAQRTEIRDIKRDARTKVKATKAEYKSEIAEKTRAAKEADAKYRENYYRGQEHTTAMIATTLGMTAVAATAGTAPLRKGRRFAQQQEKAYRVQTAANLSDSRGLPSPNVISLRPDESRWG